MNFLRMIYCSLAFACLTFVPAHGEQLLYLASTKAKTIVAHAVDSQSGKLSNRFSVNLPGNPGPLAFSPDRAFVYAAVTGLADGKAGVVTLGRKEDGSLEVLSTARITSRSPYIRTDKTGRLLLAAHYGAGDVTVYQIVDGICTSELLGRKKTEKTAHAIELDPSGQFVFVPHTSPNKVYQFRLDATSGKLRANDPPFVDGPDSEHKYHEPRHYAHHPYLNVAYTSNENGGGISAWTFDTKNGTLRLLQTLSTLPPDFQGRSAAADIKVTPNGRFAYVSNRDVTDRRNGDTPQDTIAGVSLDPGTGKMKLVGYFPTAPFPRSFCIDLTGQFLYSAGQRSAELVAYRIDQDTGRLAKIATYATGEVPIWVMCGPVTNDALTSIPKDYQLVWEEDFSEPAAMERFVFSQPAHWKRVAVGDRQALDHDEVRSDKKYSPPHRSPRNIALIATHKFGSFVLDFEVQQTGKEYGHRDACVFYGFSDPAHFYYTHISTKSDPHAHQIFTVDGKPRTAITNTGTNGFNWGKTDQWHRVRVVRNLETGKIVVYANDMQTSIMEATDHSHGEGFIGFGSFDDTGRMTNIRIYSPNASKAKPEFFER